MSTCTIDNQGRVVVPSKWRQKQGIQPGAELLVIEEKGRLILQTHEQAVREAQEMVRDAVRPRISLVKELLRERRASIRREIKASKRR